MDTTMKMAVAFAAGIGVGATAAYFIVSDKLNKAHEEEIDAIRELYLGSEDEDEESEDVNPVEDEDDDEEEEDEDEDEDPDPNDYEKLVNDGPSETPEGVEEIDKNEFYDGYTDYEECTIKLHTDKVLLDEVGDEVKDIPYFFGKIDIYSYEPGDTIYFANHTAMLKIELEVLKTSYTRDILGLDDEELGNFGDKN